MEYVSCENGKKRNQGIRQERHQEADRHQACHSFTTPEELDSLPHAVQHGPASLRGNEIRVYREQGRNDGKVGDAVQSKAPGWPQLYKSESSESRTDDASEVELEGV